MTDHRPSHAPDRTPPRTRLWADLLAATAVAGTVIALVAGPRYVQAAAHAGTVPEDGDPARTDTVPAQTLRPPLSDSLVNPVVVRSVNGVLDATLDVRMAPLPVPTSATASTLDTLRAYTLTATTDRTVPASALNQPRFPGPTFRVRRGDLVRIKLRNSLPETLPDSSNTVCQPYAAAQGPTPADTFQDCFHGPNYTNIHYHGMHVTPDSTSTVVGDDVLMAIAPKGTIQYSFRIPHNQSPGTHWYHPHKHGSVALQVANGMSGAFIVYDPTDGLDRLTAQHRMREHLIAIQQVGNTLGLLPGAGLTTNQPLVNGQFQPVIFMAPGEVQRWRIVNENVAHTTKTFDVGFVDQDGIEEPLIYDIARDGVQLAPENYDPHNPDLRLHMAPGQRLDVFAKAPTRHGLHLFQVAHVPGTGRTARRETLPRRAGGGTPNLQATGPSVIAFRVYVDSTLKGRNTYLPRTLPALPPFLRGDLPGAADTAVVVFTDTLKGQPTQFFLGSQTTPHQRFSDTVFVPSTAAGKKLPMVLNQTQTWKIINNSPHQINHPFHIHINPFQVDSVYAPRDTADPFHYLYKQLNTAARNKTPIWLDVLPLPQPTLDAAGNITDTAYVFITQKYDHFEGCKEGDCGPPTGKFVMHCHILGHEERGMMQILEITRDGKVSPPSATGGGGHPPHHHATPAGQGQERRPQGAPRPQRPPVRKDPQQHRH